jgi:hypothetical protein
MMTENLNPADVLGKPLELPCGIILKNRLVKAPMSDSLGNGEGDPTADGPKAEPHCLSSVKYRETLAFQKSLVIWYLDRI